MITFEKYSEIVKNSFSFLITEFEFNLNKIVENGNMFYDIEYSGINKIIPAPNKVENKAL